jgi:hypothetical protein
MCNPSLQLGMSVNQIITFLLDINAFSEWESNLFSQLYSMLGVPGISNTYLFYVLP